MGYFKQGSKLKKAGIMAEDILIAENLTKSFDATPSSIKSTFPSPREKSARSSVPTGGKNRPVNLITGYHL
jgi:hypothetical protein